MKLSNEIWAVIPARSGSKGLKNKNIKIFKKKPLIGHSIFSAKQNDLIDIKELSLTLTTYKNSIIDNLILKLD